jgi:hypothetical protein
MVVHHVSAAPRQFTFSPMYDPTILIVVDTWVEDGRWFHIVLDQSFDQFFNEVLLVGDYVQVLFISSSWLAKKLSLLGLYGFWIISHDMLE